MQRDLVVILYGSTVQNKDNDDGLVIEAETCCHLK